VVSGIFSIPLDALPPRGNAASRQAASRGESLREYVGSGENRLVRFAVESLLRRERRYNPLVLHGPTGTGKSFLALGLAERWRQQFPEEMVLVTNGADFARSYANAVDTDSLSTFRKKCRSVNLFVLDDAQQMRSKRSAQNELARAIDALLDRGSWVLITHNSAPTTDAALTVRLHSRLVAGLAVPLTVPGAAARKVLLRRLAALHDVRFSDAALDLLASGTTGKGEQELTVPQLNHAVVQLGHGEETGQGEGTGDLLVDIDQVRQFLGHQFSQQQPTLRSITALTAKHFGLTSRELRGPSRRRHVVRARGIAMLLAWRLTGNSLEAVGQYFGKRDHTTVLHACRRTELLRETDAAIAQALEELKHQLKSP